MAQRPQSSSALPRIGNPVCYRNCYPNP
jgi:hypothetical protein